MSKDNKGSNKGKNKSSRFKKTYFCSVCGNPLIIDSSKRSNKSQIVKEFCFYCNKKQDFFDENKTMNNMMKSLTANKNKKK